MVMTSAGLAPCFSLDGVRFKLGSLIPPLIYSAFNMPVLTGASSFVFKNMFLRLVPNDSA